MTADRIHSGECVRSFFFLEYAVRLSRLNLAMIVASMGAMSVDYSIPFPSYSPHVGVNKPNKTSQKKRRLNARRIGKRK